MSEKKEMKHKCPTCRKIHQSQEFPPYCSSNCFEIMASCCFYRGVIRELGVTRELRMTKKQIVERRKKHDEWLEKLTGYNPMNDRSSD